MNIYVGNLPYTVKADSLRALFSPFGEVEKVKIIQDRFSGQSKGYGFVEMPSNSDADQAINALNGSMVSGKSIKVNPANSGGNRRSQKSQRRRY